MKHEWLLITLADIGTYAEMNNLTWLVPMIANVHETAVDEIVYKPLIELRRSNNVVFFPLPPHKSLQQQPNVSQS